MTELKITQIGVPGRGDQGAQEFVYIRQDVAGKVHITVPAISIHVDEEDFKRALCELFPAKGKHGGTF